MVIVHKTCLALRRHPMSLETLQMNHAALRSTGSCIQRLDGFCCCAAINPSCGHILGLSRQDSISLCKGFQTSSHINLLMPRLNFNYALMSGSYDKWLWKFLFGNTGTIYKFVTEVPQNELMFLPHAYLCEVHEEGFWALLRILLIIKTERGKQCFFFGAMVPKISSSPYQHHPGLSQKCTFPAHYTCRSDGECDQASWLGKPSLHPGDCGAG